MADPGEGFQQPSSFNNPIRPQQYRRRNGHAKSLCGFEIDNEIVPGRLLHRKVTGLGALKNPIDVECCPTEHVVEVRPVRHEPAVLDKERKLIHGGNATCRGKLENSLSMDRCKGICQHEKGIGTVPSHGGERGIEIFGLAHAEWLESHAQNARSPLDLSVRSIIA